ncbi:mucin-2 [Rhea pennata]|uniref:mucin-2 n=1 Tax=Rhea pennata TaxID=8795 RepID=UPI002E254E25
MGLRTASLFILWLALSYASEIRKGRTRSHGHYVCSTWGSNHFKTFDGDIYQFPGICEYNFASDCRESYKEFSVQIQRSLNSNNHPVIQYILITVKDFTVYLAPKLAVVDGQIVKTPYYSSGVFIENNDIYTKVYAKLGLILMWNQEDALMVELDSKFNNYTCGLCGDYNGIPIYNEFISGVSSYNSITYGNLQKISKPNARCEDPDETQALPSCNKHRDECERLLTSSTFADCHSRLDVEMYVQACMQDKCACNGSEDSFCLCSTISEYSRQCSHAGGRPGEWRTQHFCPKTCPGNMIYKESSSPCMDSCSHLEISSLCEEHYMDGCFCPEGTVYDDITEKGCVPVSECHCKLHGKAYSPGQNITGECEECTCDSGRWTCKDLPCPGTCSLEGGSHFTTFDGKKYTFHGDCYYVLAKGTASDSYVLLAELSPCGFTDWQTCLKTVVLLTDHKKNVVVFRSDGSVLLNEMTVSVPHVSASFSIFKPSSYYLIVQTSFGLQLQIQLLPVMQLFATVDPSAKESLEGLCGNFNGIEGDDFQTASGVVEATGSAFANTWKAQSTCADKLERLEDPCSLSVESANYAEHWCSLLKNSEGPFARCHLVIDPSEYYKKCKYDTCLCKDGEKCLCAALSSYSRACAFKGIILGGWRQTICTNEVSACPESQIFLYNLTMCQQTCRSVADGEKHCFQDFVPVDGCGCPDNTYLDNQGTCVPISKCPCYYKGSYLEPGDYVTKDEERCVCRNAKLQCTSVTVGSTKCPPHKTYFDCNTFQNWTSQTPIQFSCYTPRSDHFQAECVSGCVCPQGLFDDGKGGCVEEKDCPCIHNNQWYSHGDEITVDCKTCICQRGGWNCTKGDVCYGTCTIYGSGHYITFDGKFYDFDGSCEYVATQDFCGDKNSSSSFSIITENVPCGTTGVTCSKAIKMFLGNTELKLENKDYKEIQRDIGDEVHYRKRAVGLYLVIEASNGVMLIWDKKTTIFIKLTADYQGKVCGLCGNFDGKSNNDFTTRSGLQETSALEFGNSWKQSYTCPDVTEEILPCSVKPHRKSWAEKECYLIRSAVFEICHSKVDPTPFYEACVHDACSCDSGGDCECFCSAVAAYAQECIKAKACVFWRTPDICPIFCDYYNPPNECEWHYEPCGSDILTCKMINNVSTNFSVPYLEGCYPRCPPEKPIYNEETKKCETRDDCGCYFNGTYYEPEEEILVKENCRRCVCVSSGNINCTTIQGCPCVINGTRYEVGELVGQITEGDECKIYVCGQNGSIMEITVPCPTTLPTISSTSFSTPTITASCFGLICDWTEWYDVSNPEEGDGDYETYDAIRDKHGNVVCEAPEKIECRAKNNPSLSLEELGQKVECNVTYGLICKNEEQSGPWSVCYNYEIRVNCCEWHEVPCETTQSPAPTTTFTTTSTTILTATTAWQPTVTTTTPKPTPVTTSKPTPPSTTPVTSTTTGPPVVSCDCVWTDWISVSYPSVDADGGEDESYENIQKHDPSWVCVKAENISCRAKDFPNTPIEELGQKVECNVNTGLTCKNKDQVVGGLIPMPVCLNYEISVCCVPNKPECIPSTTPSTTVTTTPSTTETTTRTATPSVVPTSTTPYSTASTSVWTTTTTTTSGTPSPTPTTIFITSSPSPTPTTSLTPPTATTAGSCLIVSCDCVWTGWINVSYPTVGADGGEDESYGNIQKHDPSWVCVKAENISCRAKDFPNTPIEELGQKVECDVNTGLTCKNKDQVVGGPIPMPVCLNYEISVCCVPNKPECITSTTPSTTVTTTPSTTVTTTPSTTETTTPSTTVTTTPSTTVTTTPSTMVTTTPSTTVTTTPSTTETTTPSTTETTTPSTTVTTTPSTTETTTPSTTVTTTPSTTETTTPSTTVTTTPSTTETTTPSTTVTTTPSTTETTTPSTTVTTTPSTTVTTTPSTTETTTPSTTVTTTPSTTETTTPSTTVTTTPSTTETTTPSTTVTTTPSTTETTTPSTTVTTTPSTTETTTPSTTVTTTPSTTETTTPSTTVTTTPSTTVTTTPSTTETTTPSTTVTTTLSTTETTTPSTTETTTPSTTVTTTPSTTETTTPSTTVTTTPSTTETTTPSTMVTTTRSTTVTTTPSTTETTTPSTTVTTTPSTTVTTTRSTTVTTTPSTTETTTRSTTVTTTPSTTETTTPSTTVTTTPSTTETTTPSTTVTTTPSTTVTTTRSTTVTTTPSTTVTTTPSTTETTTPSTTVTTTPSTMETTTPSTTETTTPSTTVTTTPSTTETTTPSTTVTTTPSTTETTTPSTTVTTTPSTTETTTPSTTVTTTPSTTVTTTPSTTETTTPSTTVTTTPSTTETTTPSTTVTTTPSTTVTTTPSTTETTTPSTMVTTTPSTTETTTPSTTETTTPSITETTTPSTTETTTPSTTVTTTPSTTVTTTPSTTETTTPSTTVTTTPSTTETTTPSTTVTTTPSTTVTTTPSTTETTTRSTTVTTTPSTTETTTPSTTVTTTPSTTVTTTPSTTETTTPSTTVTTTPSTTETTTPSTTETTTRSTTETTTASTTVTTTPSTTETTTPSTTVTTTLSTTETTTPSTTVTTTPSTTETTTPSTTVTTTPSTTETTTPSTTVTTTPSTTETTTPNTTVTTTPSTTVTTTPSTTETTTRTATPSEVPTSTTPYSTASTSVWPTTATTISGTLASTPSTVISMTSSSTSTLSTTIRPVVVTQTSELPISIPMENTSSSTGAPTNTTTNTTPLATSLTSVITEITSTVYTKTTTTKPPPKTVSTSPVSATTSGVTETTSTTEATTHGPPVTSIKSTPVFTTTSGTTEPTSTSSFSGSTVPFTTYASFTTHSETTSIESTSSLETSFPVSATTSGTTPTESFTTTSGTTSTSSTTTPLTTTTSSEIVSLVSTTTSEPTAVSSTVTISGTSTYKTVTTVSSTSAVPSTTPGKYCSIFPNQSIPSGDSFWLCNCTKVICIEDNKVEVIPVICNPPPKPTCTNGLAPVQVVDEDGCCWHWECDCYCTGWGDPHYMTFDGHYYSYQGNCTYVLVEEINKSVDNFGVYIDNYHCDARDPVSCPRTLIVRHETQEVRIATVQPNSLKVQVTVNKQAVALPYKKFGLTVYESGINRVVEIPELKMNVTYNGLSFSIRMPYSLFGNNTQGQCGTCNNDTADDCMLPNGNIAENCETMADHWQVVDPSKPQCSPGIIPTKKPSTTTGQPCKEASICQLLLGSVFEKCHKYVYPEKYYAACVFDSCTLPQLDLECSSLQIYAATCADQGICIDWRTHTNGVCSYKCPAHKEYRACGPTKEMTCKSSPEQQNQTETEQMEGCFCPNGTMLYDSGVDVCVKTCGCVGLDNIPREYGEKFTVDCKDCICLEGENGIVCEAHKCAEQNEISCDGEGFFKVTEINSEDPCCSITTCKCNTSLCTSKAPKCKLGFEVHSHIPSGQCCPEYQCVSKGVCVHQNAEFLPDSPVFVDKCQNCICTNEVNVTTQLNVISCEHIPCDTYCEPGYERQPVKGECCGKCVQTKCVIHVLESSLLILSPGEFKNDPYNNCTVYSCVNIHNQLISSTSEITCPAFNEETCKPGTITFLPNGCCKTCAPLDSPTPCSVRHREDFIFHQGCHSLTRVDLTECEGTCGTFSLYSAEANSMEHSCSCCREAKTSVKEVELKCPTGRSITHQYVYVESCSCQDTVCEISKSKESTSTEENDKQSALDRIKRAISLTSK